MKIISFQMSLFGKFNITPDMELTDKIGNSLKEENFIPSIAVLNIVDPVEKKIVQKNFPQFETKDHSWLVCLFPNRIDVNYLYNENGIIFSDIDTIIKECKRKCCSLYLSDEEIKGTRIAINGRFVIDAISKELCKKFISNYSKIPFVYGDKPVTEWREFFNSPCDVFLGNMSETCNYIIELIKTNDVNHNSELSAITIGLDINTSQLNSCNKYTKENMLQFADSVCQMMKSSISEFEGILK